MLKLTATEVSDNLKSLFDPNEPAALRCFAVLNGDTIGQILTDDAANPTWGVIREAAFGTIYLGGACTAPVIEEVITELRRDGDVLIGLWHGDPRLPLLPPNPEYDGLVLDFTDRRGDLDIYLNPIPRDYEMRRADETLMRQSTEHELRVSVFGSEENLFKQSISYCLMDGDAIACETFAGPPALGIIEVGVETKEAYRKRGFALLTCAHLIQACEAEGYPTYWNCAKQNTPSALLARKLGYQTEKEYRLLAWFKTVS